MAMIVNLDARRKVAALDVELFDDFYARRAKMFPADAPHIIEAPDADDELTIPLKTRYPNGRRATSPPWRASLAAHVLRNMGRGRRSFLSVLALAFELLLYALCLALAAYIIGALSAFNV